jgi:16S rRNA (guanine527-N7)-methyltransferase
MEDKKDNFYNIIKTQSSKLEINLTQNEINLFKQYMDVLIKWNEKMNLTAIIETKEIILKHFIDSLTINKYINSNDSIIDIGTGAGLPGIPIKILHPQNKIVLMDSLNKRIMFLKEVITKLELKNIEAIHSRAEELAVDVNHRERYEIVTSRAVGAMNILVEYMIPFAKINGLCICMKGSNYKEELEQSNKAIIALGGKVEKIEEMVLPDTEIKRTLILIRKIKNTDEKYPRKPGIPAKTPIV